MPKDPLQYALVNQFLWKIFYQYFLSNAPPPVKVNPISTKSADNSGGVFSKASLIPLIISFKIGFKASEVSSSVIFTSFGVPDLRSLPLTGYLLLFVGIAVPILF